MSQARLPVTVHPMLATLGPMPTGPEWAYEFKWDGVRAIVSVAGERVRATSRNDLDITVSYPELALLPAQLGGRRLLLDGELVTLDTDGVTSFSLLQQRMHTKNPAAALVSRIPVLFYAFDLLWLDNAPTLSWTYTQRRETLEGLSRTENGPISIPPSFSGPGQALLDAAAEHRLEGVVAKRLDAAYIAGRRSPAWIKIPLNRTQEGIIIGWRSGEGNRTGTIGSLLLAAKDGDGKLSFIGAVGTGFTRKMLTDLQRQLEETEIGASPLTGRPVPREYLRGARWCEPTLVGEVQFRNWTPDSTMRHPSWRGLRPDKTPGDVSRLD
ncbi:non-homologous end-joining DNA ligase [Rhizocola hellebori]|nr:non-homologous end-joining DNA ligase [Rhizocola hellebori]